MGFLLHLLGCHKTGGILGYILSLIVETIIAIKASYDVENDRFALISEKSCDKFEINIQKYVLYLTDSDLYILKYMFELLRKNDSWQYNFMFPEENAGFNMKDINVIEYLYETLVDNFRNQLFDIKSKRNINMLKMMEIKYLKISSFLQSVSLNEEIGHALIEICNKFNFRENTIKDTIDYFKNNTKELILLLEDIKKIYAREMTGSNCHVKCYEEIEQYILIMKNKNV
jgi:hypothetical protein